MHISKGPFRLGPWTVDPSRCLIRAGQETHRLEPKVMDVLCVLAHARGDVVSRPEILDTVWSGTHVTDGVLTRAVSLLRTALDDGSGTKVIETVPRRGYRLAQPVAATAPPDSPAANEGPRSIAVLPFADFSAQSTEHLADGLTDVLIAELARLRALRVISRTSVMAYGRGPRRLRQIGDELGADLIVEGSVQKLGGELRITAQLIDAKTDDHLWAESYVRPTEDLMRLLSDVASEIAQEVRVSITAEERRAMALRAPSPRVVDTYLRGRHLWSLRSREAFLQAIDLFEQVLQIDPHHVESMSAMADCHTTLALYGAVPATDAFPKALRAAQKALECDAGSPDANRAMAAVHLFWSWQLPEAEAGFRRCLERAPSDTQARLGLADTLAFAGRSDEAIREIRTARKLDPLDPGMGMNVGDILLFSGRFRDAVEAYLDTSRRSPAFARVTDGWRRRSGLSVTSTGQKRRSSTPGRRSGPRSRSSWTWPASKPRAERRARHSSWSPSGSPGKSCTCRPSRWRRCTPSSEMPTRRSSGSSERAPSAHRGPSRWGSTPCSCGCPATHATAPSSTTSVCLPWRCPGSSSPDGPSVRGSTRGLSARRRGRHDRLESLVPIPGQTKPTRCACDPPRGDCREQSDLRNAGYRVPPRRLHPLP